MHRRSIAWTVPAGGLLISLGIFLLAGCGSTTTASTLSPSAATATACAQATRPASAFKTATGTLKSINGSTLVVTNQQSKDVTVNYTSTTSFMQESIVAATSLQEGTLVRVTVTSSGSTYAATTITVTGGGNGFPRANGTPGTGSFPGRGRNPCVNRGQRPNGNGTGNFRGLVGTISQVSATTMTITETSGSDFSVTITPQTKVVQTKATTAAALKVGTLLSVTGTSGSQGEIAARAVIILLSLPTTTSTP